MQKQGQYKIHNHSEYTKSLINRGDITLRFSEDLFENWFATSPTTPKEGRPFLFSDTTIECCLAIQHLTRMPLRAVQGFIRGLLNRLGLNHLPVPCYTQISRRAKAMGSKLKDAFNCLAINSNVTDIAIDSTGLKVYGEGEWKTRQHGYSKRRVWRKLHLGVCPDTHEIIVGSLTTHKIHDSSMFEPLLAALPEGVEKVLADKGYDSQSCYKAGYERNIKVVVPPRKNAVLKADPPPYLLDRQQACQEIQALGGDDAAHGLWKKEVEYHKRSNVETAMHRFKQAFGDRLRSRTIEGQKAEVWTKILILNDFVKKGMPDSSWCPF